ncbi:MAG: polymer-forming cytoskeletal protein, partial [Pseudomonadales bacterium]|nr:polymer-forming cytoskeletal protein [Pseudomonadales bacterium]
MFEKKKDADISQPAPVPTSPEKISHSQKPTANNTATIGPSISIHGDISGEENLVIYGKVDGKITLGKNDVT